jgi:hypothetical protein
MMFHDTGRQLQQEETTSLKTTKNEVLKVKACPNHKTRKLQSKMETSWGVREGPERECINPSGLIQAVIHTICYFSSLKLIPMGSASVETPQAPTKIDAQSHLSTSAYRINATTRMLVV